MAEQLTFGGLLTAAELRADLAPPHPASASKPCQSDNAPHARRTDPTTSHAAAKRAGSFAASHRNRIMAALRDGPANIYEIAERTKIDHVAVARRMIELERAELAVPTDEKREGCRVWRAR